MPPLPRGLYNWFGLSLTQQCDLDYCGFADQIPGLSSIHDVKSQTALDCCCNLTMLQIIIRKAVSTIKCWLEESRSQTVQKVMHDRVVGVIL